MMTTEHAYAFHLDAVQDGYFFYRTISRWSGHGSRCRDI